MLKAFAKDAEPEDVAEAMEAIKAKDSESEVEKKEEKSKLTENGLND